MSGLRQVIRELLREELARIGGDGKQAGPGPAQVETVSIASSADLSAFASRVLSLAQNPSTAEQIARGNYPFRLADATGTGQGAARNTAASVLPTSGDHCFEKGVVSEKDIANLTNDTRRVCCGATVCLTPLAKDALRRRGIKIVRNTP